MQSVLSRRIIILLSIALLSVIVAAALGPSRSIPRTGLGWQFDHFMGYLVFTSLFCQIWRRAFTVGVGVTAFAIALEICQGFTPDRMPDVMGAFYSTSGILTAAVLADFLSRAGKQFLVYSFLRAPY